MNLHENHKAVPIYNSDSQLHCTTRSGLSSPPTGFALAQCRGREGAAGTPRSAPSEQKSPSLRGEPRLVLGQPVLLPFPHHQALQVTSQRAVWATKRCGGHQNCQLEVPFTHCLGFSSRLLLTCLTSQSQVSIRDKDTGGHPSGNSESKRAPLRLGASVLPLEGLTHFIFSLLPVWKICWRGKQGYFSPGPLKSPRGSRI